MPRNRILAPCQDENPDFYSDIMPEGKRRQFTDGRGGQNLTNRIRELERDRQAISKHAGIELIFVSPSTSVMTWLRRGTKPLVAPDVVHVFAGC